MTNLKTFDVKHVFEVINNIFEKEGRKNGTKFNGTVHLLAY